jgi:hypothetical protein
MARPLAAKWSPARRFRQVVVGLAALSALMALFFVLLRWRTNTPEQHLNFGGVVEQLPRASDE